jgi:methylglutaconyl-CoA hydratase
VSAGVGELRVERSHGGAVARVTLDRPQVRNAFDAALIEELRETFVELAAEPATTLRAVVLAGAGPAFCAGADVSWMRASLGMSAAENEADAARMAAMFDALDGCPAPLVARVHGAALGGGMGLCAVADIVIAEGGTTFGFTETRLGILPAVVSPFVVAKIGTSHARALFPPGSRFGPARALGIGLVHEIVDGVEALDARIDAILAELMSAGPLAARAAKALVRDVAGRAPRDVEAMTVRRIAQHRTGPEGQEGLAAFLERREPDWRR